MEDRQIRIAIQVFLTLLVFLLCNHDWKLFLIGLIVANGLAYAFAPVLNFVSSVISSLIYGSTGSSDSYEDRFYRADMDQARKMVRESTWDEAISSYRKIVEKAPMRTEARFELAKTYQVAGYIGLALLEYQRIRESGSELGKNHPFVLESAKLIEKLKEVISEENKPSSPPL